MESTSLFSLYATMRFHFLYVINYRYYDSEVKGFVLCGITTFLSITIADIFSSN